MAAIVGMHPWVTPYALWLDKRGELEDSGPNAAQRLGHVLEPEIRHWYEQQSAGCTWMPGSEMAWRGGTRDPACPIFANTDGEVQLLSGKRAVWEAKAVLYPAGRKRWADGPPDHVRLQVELYMLVTGLPAALVVVCFGFRDDGNLHCEAWWIEASERRQASIRRIVATWWQRHMVDGVAPDVRGPDVALLLGKERDGEACDLEYRHDMMAVRACEIRCQRTALEDEYEDIRARILQDMGEHSSGHTPDGRVWRVTSNGRLQAPRR